jgi:ankyrin repeat protein
MDDKTLIKTIKKGIRGGKSDLVLKAFAEHPELVSKVTQFGSWLHLAADHGQLTVVQYLVNQGVEIDLEAGILETNALSLAAGSGHLEIVRYLLDQGSSMILSSSQKNPLYAAIYGNHPEVAKELVKRGLDHTISYEENKNGNATAIEFARLWGRTEIAEFLESQIDPASKEIP